MTGTTPNYGLVIPNADGTDLMDASLWRTPFGQVDTSLKGVADRTTSLETVTQYGAGVNATVAANWTLDSFTMSACGKMRWFTFAATKTVAGIAAASGGNAAGGNVTNTPIFTVAVGHRPRANVAIACMDGDYFWAGMMQSTGICYVVMVAGGLAVPIGSSLTGTCTYIQEN